MVRNNNFDILRLIAATLVVVSHGFGFENEYDPLFQLTGFITIGTLSVYVFFIISGYLIAKSWERNQDVFIFLSNRILRIFPALIFVVFFTIFIVGPLFTNASFFDYFSNNDVYRYFSNITLIKLQPTLPNVFVKNGVEHTVNAPLWTLVFEFAMYIMVLFLGKLKIIKSDSNARVIICVLVLISIIYYTIGIDNDLFFLKFHVRNFIQFFIYFFLGTIFYLYRDILKLRRSIALISTLLLIGFYFTPFLEVYLYIYMPYTILYLAINAPTFGKFIVKHGDFSYGIYIFGYLVQNTIYSLFGEELNVFTGVVLALSITFIIAFFSWKFIESKALQLKSRVKTK